LNRSVGGFSARQTHKVVEVKDVDEAVVVAQGYPILEFDGSVEVRPFI
jgi:hypothetical protein